MKQASYWEPVGQGKVKCKLCPHGCIIMPGKKGICRARENREGQLYPAAYGQVSSLGLDPVEKKPLFHFEPGSILLSVGTFGCNLACRFCQNWQISQGEAHLTSMTPRQLVDLAKEKQDELGRVTGIAYTYNEPTVWWEFVVETAELAREAGLKNVLVTNGYISQEALREGLPLIDAMNIDVKSWDESFYRKVAGGHLEPVRRTVETAFDHAWIEVTYLVVPGLNDSEEEIEALSCWLRDMSPAIPLHLSRYFPAFRMDRPPTPLATLERLRLVARRHLHYVYIGNAWKKGYADTVCPECKEVLIQRGALEIESSSLVEGACPRCKRALELGGRVWV